MELLLVVSLYSMSFETSGGSGTTPLAKRLNVCHTISMRDREMAELQAEYEAECFEASASRFTSCPQPLDFPTNLCHTNSMTFNRSQLITALLNEYKFLCHDDFDPEVDATPDEYLTMLQSLSDDELIAEASADDVNEFISTWS